MTPYQSTRSSDDVNDLSMEEGWALFWSDSDSTDEISSTRRLACDDEAEDFGGDDEVWAHVVARALSGSALHLDALACLRDEGPVDFAHNITSTSNHERLLLSKKGIFMDDERIKACIGT